MCGSTDVIIFVLFIDNIAESFFKWEDSKTQAPLYTECIIWLITKWSYTFFFNTLTIWRMWQANQKMDFNLRKIKYFLIFNTITNVPCVFASVGH